MAVVGQGATSRVKEGCKALASPLRAPLKVVLPVVVVNEALPHRLEEGRRHALQHLSKCVSVSSNLGVVLRVCSVDYQV